jgi:hypothetical protein
MRFTFRSGQRPLDGYTLKRGVGQGGFGEVYFAVSDGGKEVALKLLKGHSEVELRGVANCLNLKHPNLVHVYDLRADPDGNHWLVMEYVLGESLAGVIARHPHGLPLNLCREWFLSLCRAVGYLHDHGVVHRDIKPANVFVENGTLKVGDYGLCKSLNSDQKQTRTVGTVHYMAPEVGTGNYTKSIDVYACGVVLHEMLTGTLPFDGESDGEILMKHLTATPDLALVPEAYRAVVAKALDKNPVRRYGSLIEFARAVEAVAESAPGPAVQPIPAAAIPPAPPPAQPLPDLPSGEPVIAAAVPVAIPLAQPLPPAPSLAGTAFRDRLTDAAGAMAKAPLIAAASLVPVALLAQTTDPVALGKLFLVTSLASWAILIGSAGRRYKAPDAWGPRLRLGLLGLLVGAVAYWADGWPTPTLAAGDGPPLARGNLLGAFHLPPGSGPVAAGYLLYFGGVLAAGRWWRATARDRKERVSLFPPVAAGFWGLVLAFLWPWGAAGPVWDALIPLVLATVAAQSATAWEPPPPPAPKKLRFRA